jgi:hypothetical protein
MQILTFLVFCRLTAPLVIEAASDVVTAMVYDSATGKSVTSSSVGTDALYGVISGLVGERIGRAVGTAGKAAIRGLKSAQGAVSEFLRNAEKLKIAGDRPRTNFRPLTAEKRRIRIQSLRERIT